MARLPRVSAVNAFTKTPMIISTPTHAIMMVEQYQEGTPDGASYIDKLGQINRTRMLINNKTSPKSLSAKPMLLIYPRMYVRRLSGEFSGAICMDAN